ncbi:MAG: hypothetical protein K2Y37_05080 [Pirellulales bacterium]|nr:hypothetical protein [Pirellulales bacterium]
MQIAFGKLIALVGLMLLGANTGCAVGMAYKLPPKRDLTVLAQGTPRTHVIAELGQPVWSGAHAGQPTDVYAFRQGVTKPVKAGRMVGHAAADFFTFGLWEVVGTPAEMLLDGQEIKVEVQYDGDQQVAMTRVIEGQSAFDDRRWWSRAKTSPAAQPAAEPMLDEPEAPLPDDGTQLMVRDPKRQRTKRR